jgi:predicted enzyme involved in methoxymalonyl-ACP biosynthesis
MNHETKSNNITDAAYLKKQYVSAAALGDTPLMVSLAQKLLASHATLGVAQQIINTLQASLPGRQAIHLRVAFLRSYTVEPVLPFLKALALLYGIELTVRVGEFNSYVQEIIDPASWLYDFDPHVVVLAVQTRDILPGVWSGSSNLREEGLDPIAQFVSLVDSLRSRSQASFVFQSLEQPVYESNGLLDGRAECGQAETIRMKNAQLFAAARNREGVYVLDYDGLVARHGRERWSDERKWLTTRLPIAADNLILMAREYLRWLAARGKCWLRTLITLFGAVS